MTKNSLTKMKPKGRWIDKYNSEFNDKVINVNGVCESTEMFELFVKPKSIWFAQHVISEGISSSDETSSLEDGEILSDFDEDEDQDKPIVNCKETNEIRQMSPVSDNVITVVKFNGHFGNIRRDSYTIRNSWKVYNEKSKGSFHTHKPPGYDRNIHNGFNGYERCQWRANGHGLRYVPDHYKSPKPYPKRNRSLDNFNNFCYRKPLIASPWNSSGSSSYDRSSIDY